MAENIGISDCGVNLVIEETLGLAADQQSKVESASSSQRPLLPYQLVSIKKASSGCRIERYISK